jgi:hypothetical protein
MLNRSSSILLLISIAVLFLATSIPSYAHAADPNEYDLDEEWCKNNPKYPTCRQMTDRNQFAPEMLGLWCIQEGHNILAPRSTSYRRENCRDQDNRFILKSNEIKEWESGCSIIKIKRGTVPDVHSYETEERCAGEGYTWKQKVRYVYFDGIPDVLISRVLWHSRFKPEK